KTGVHQRIVLHHRAGLRPDRQQPVQRPQRRAVGHMRIIVPNKPAVQRRHVSQQRDQHDHTASHQPSFSPRLVHWTWGYVRTPSRANSLSPTSQCSKCLATNAFPTRFHRASRRLGEGGRRGQMPQFTIPKHPPISYRRQPRPRLAKPVLGGTNPTVFRDFHFSNLLSSPVFHVQFRNKPIGFVSQKVPFFATHYLSDPSPQALRSRPFSKSRHPEPACPACGERSRTERTIHGTVMYCVVG